MTAPDYVRQETTPPFQGKAISNEHMHRPLADRLLERKRDKVQAAAQMVLRQAYRPGSTGWSVIIGGEADLTVSTRPVWGPHRGRRPIGTDLDYRVRVPVDWSKQTAVLGGPIIMRRLVLKVRPIRECSFGSWVIAEVVSVARSRGFEVRLCTDIAVRLGKLGEEGTEVKFLGDLNGDFTKAYRHVERMLRPRRSRKSNQTPDPAPGVVAFTPIPQEDVDALGSF